MWRHRYRRGRDQRSPAGGRWQVGAAGRQRALEACGNAALYEMPAASWRWRLTAAWHSGGGLLVARCGRLCDGAALDNVRIALRFSDFPWRRSMPAWAGRTGVWCGGA